MTDTINDIVMGDLYVVLILITAAFALSAFHSRNEGRPPLADVKHSVNDSNTDVRVSGSTVNSTKKLV